MTQDVTSSWSYGVLRIYKSIGSPWHLFHIVFFWLPPNHQPSQPYIPPPDRVSTSLFDDFADIPATLLFSQGLQMDIEGRGIINCRQGRIVVVFNQYNYIFWFILN